MIRMTDDARDRILGRLGVGPATITAMAAGLGLAEGVVSYHLTLLERAGLVRVLGTRVRQGVRERTYVPTVFPTRTSPPRVSPPPVLSSPVSFLPPEPAPGVRIGLEAAPVQSPRMLDIRQVSVDTSTFYEFAERFAALAREFSARSTPGAPAAQLTIALYRPPAEGASEGNGS
jgi:DNA-binding transcriptional ArsR family regulator